MGLLVGVSLMCVWYETYKSPSIFPDGLLDENLWHLDGIDVVKGRFRQRVYLRLSIVQLCKYREPLVN